MNITTYSQYNLKSIKYREKRLNANSWADFQKYKFLEYYFKWLKAKESLKVANQIGKDARATAMRNINQASKAMRNAYQLHKETI